MNQSGKFLSQPVTAEAVAAASDRSLSDRHAMWSGLSATVKGSVLLPLQSLTVNLPVTRTLPLLLLII